MPRTLQSFAVPRGKRDILAAIENHHVIRAMRRTPNGGIVSRDMLCRLIHVDPAPLSSPDPIIRDAFVQWFHRYLRILRDAILAANIPALLEYPDRENDAGENTGGGHGVALIMLHSEHAAAFLLLKSQRESLCIQKRHAKRIKLLLSEDSQFMPESRRSRDSLRALMNSLLHQTRGAVEISRQLTTAAMEQLPSLDPYFNTVLETVITPESTDDE